MHRFAAALAGVCLAAAGTTAVVLAGPATAAPACSVGYRVNQWQTGFTAEITVTNGATALSSWTLTWHYAGSQSVTSAWNATVRQAGTAVTAESLPYNASLPAGGTVSFGLQGTSTGPDPTDFALNGVACGDTTTPPATTTSVTPTTTTSTPAPAGCAAAAVCDDFEQQTGSAPAGRWTVGAANCQGTGTVTVDTAVAHSGFRSVKVAGGGGYCNHAFFGTSVPGSGVLYGRFWVRHTTALPTGHVTFLALRDSADGGRDLRAGGQNQALQWNRESDDATLPAQSPAGVAQSVPLPTGTWSCFEFAIDGAAGQLRTWLGSAAVPGLVVDGVPTPDVDQQWLARAWHPAVTDFRLGWESYGGDADTLWFDDVALGSARIGC
ncbi:cellulose-binding domain-containing protein [Amycolatopsis sp. NPDC101161]|uniref:cellulose-binding domain-containing protein n=1 Tax=Amycolatopsis sp. NPDC101161 TaxID=3363940 RepID=UPI003809F6C1